MIVSTRPEMKLRMFLGVCVCGGLDCTIKSKLDGIHKQRLSFLNVRLGFLSFFLEALLPARANGNLPAGSITRAPKFTPSLHQAVLLIR